MIVSAANPAITGDWTNVFRTVRYDAVQGGHARRHIFEHLEDTRAFQGFTQDFSVSNTFSGLSFFHFSALPGNLFPRRRLCFYPHTMYEDRVLFVGRGSDDVSAGYL